MDDPIGKLRLKGSSETLVIDFNNLLPLYSNLLNQIQTSHRVYPSIRATSQLTGDLGPEGLFLIAPPGWHSERNPKYPQSISIDFNEVKSIGRISLLPQDGHSSRMPKNIQIKSSSDAKTWTTVASFDDICDTEQEDNWRILKLNEQLNTRYFKMEIHANCGDPLITLRGLKLD